MKSEDPTSDTMNDSGIEAGLTTPVTTPPIKHLNTTSSSGGRKRRIPLDCITNGNDGSLIPKRTMPAKQTRQITLNELLTKQERKH